MKILFINPWSPDEEGVHWTPEYQTNYWRNPYYGLVGLATYVRSLGHDTAVIDLERDLLIEAGGNPGLLLKQLKEKITALEPDIIGLTGMTWRYGVVDRIIKTIAPLSDRMGFKIIQGGAHAIAAPESCLNNHHVLDAVFDGYAELGLKEYLKGRHRSDVPGIVYRNFGSSVSTLNAYIKNLDDLPFPDWNMVDFKFYAHPSVWIHRSYRTPIRNLDTIASRGCVYHCQFCTAYSTRPIWHSARYILEYISYLKKDFGINGTIFQDSSLGNNRNLLVEICEGLINSGVSKGLIWTACMRANQVNEGIAKLMYRAGCRMVFIGFESASDRMLEKINKGVTQADNIRCAQILEKVGLPYWASFIVGYPTETEAELKETYDFAMSIHPLAGWPNRFFPCPGSIVFSELLNEGRIKQPKKPSEWVALSHIDRGKEVERGEWADMKHSIFTKLVAEFQSKMQEVTDRGMQRKLEFPE